MERDRRHRVIEQILAEGPVASQELLLAELARRGIKTTQATLSRDLRDLGVLKGPNGYMLPGAINGGPADGSGLRPKTTRMEMGRASIARVLARYVNSVSKGVGQVVLRTNPGYANLVALELDRFPPAGVLGTIAGDDTIFVAVDTPERVDWLVEQFALMVESGSEVDES